MTKVSVKSKHFERFHDRLYYSTPLLRRIRRTHTMKVARMMAYGVLETRRRLKAKHPELPL